ncbi:putative Diguanylate cyclase [Rhodospirillaceae bacterium LM-1]|nr:putative Diguanylate cyclase [Rhodospirillaceae bacterium LM-1]
MLNGIVNVRVVIAASRPLALASGAFALVGLGGYAFSIEDLYRPIEGGPASHPMTLLVVLLLTMAVTTRSKRGGMAAAVAALAICLLRVFPAIPQDYFEALTPFGAIVRNELALGQKNAMGVNTAFMLLLISLAALSGRSRQTKRSQTLAFLSLAFPSVAITGYAYDLPKFYGQMSLSTLTMGIPLGLAVAGMTANRGMLRAVLSPHITGRISRIQIFLGLLVPFAIGYLLIKTVGHIGDTSMFGVFVIVVSWFIIFLVSFASVIHERVDHARRLHERLLERSASIDPLTGLFNRRKFDVLCQQEEARFCRSGQPLSLIVLDIDHFKRVNDTGGHPVGDFVLKTVARLLGDHVRSVDAVGRLGGEEFAILLPNTDESGVVYKAESLRRLIESLHFDPWSGHDGQITASFGCATLMKEETVPAIFERADAALYSAKEKGRNQVILSASVQETDTGQAQEPLEEVKSGER